MQGLAPTLHQRNFREETSSKATPSPSHCRHGRHQHSGVERQPTMKSHGERWTKLLSEALLLVDTTILSALAARTLNGAPGFSQTQPGVGKEREGREEKRKGVKTAYHSNKSETSLPTSKAMLCLSPLPEGRREQNKQSETQHKVRGCPPLFRTRSFLPHVGSKQYQNQYCDTFTP